MCSVVRCVCSCINTKYCRLRAGSRKSTLITQLCDIYGRAWALNNKTCGHSVLKLRLKMLSKLPQSCDTFVVLPPLTKNNTVIFGKNSDRPKHEVQEIVLVKGGIRDKKLKCTYITIDGISPVHSVILSKPAWMWGAEIGANDKNVVIGNEAVWTNNNEGEGDARLKRLLGMDLVRLGLERAGTAEGALDIITSLLEKYGQGGQCFEHDETRFYHNSFLIADPKEAWVLETSGKIWAAEKIATGYRNISNGLTITTKMDKQTENLLEKTKELRLWDGKGEFNFMRCYSSGGDETRQREGTRLLREATASSSFHVQDMMTILRHKESRICRSIEDNFPTQGSQVSCLSATNINVHWFTATPDPTASFYKPFVFTPNAKVPPEIISPNEPRREHNLYKMHVERRGTVEDAQTTRGCKRLEAERLAHMEKYLNTPAGQSTLDELDNLLKDCVDAEINLYFEDTDDEEERGEDRAEKERAAKARAERERREAADLEEIVEDSDDDEPINFYDF